MLRYNGHAGQYDKHCSQCDLDVDRIPYEAAVVADAGQQWAGKMNESRNESQLGEWQSPDV